MTSSGFRNSLPAALLFLVMLLQFSAASAAPADSFETRSSCWASANLSEDVVAIARNQDRWSCGDQAHSIDAERVLAADPPNLASAIRVWLFERRSGGS